MKNRLYRKALAKSEKHQAPSSQGSILTPCLLLPMDTRHPIQTRFWPFKRSKCIAPVYY